VCVCVCVYVCVFVCVCVCVWLCVCVVKRIKKLFMCLHHLGKQKINVVTRKKETGGGMGEGSKRKE
jgi:hypothetical protein